MSVRDLYWRGPQSYMRALKASLVFTDKAEPLPPDGYTWDDRSGTAPSYGSGEVGESIYRAPWEEEWDGAGAYPRELLFNMWPKSVDRDGDITQAKEWAAQSGWSLWGVNALDNKDGGIAWQDFMMEFDDQPTLVQVPTSGELFECDYYKQDLFNAGGVMATFKAESVLFGAFLDVGPDYDPNDLPRYRPCENKYPGTTCEAINGNVFCDGTRLTPGDLGPTSPTSSPTAEPTSSPTTDPDSVTIAWQGDKSFMFGNNVEVTLEGQTDYCFVGETSVKLDSGSGNGPLVDRTWNEACHSRKRRVYFKASEYNGNGFQVAEGKINNENGNARLHWSAAYGSFEESYIVVPDDRWDAWTCERVEFNFINEDAGKLPGKLVADNFVIAMFLDNGYNVEDLKLFNPCHQLEGCQEGDCTCSAVDGQVMCSGSFGSGTFGSEDIATIASEGALARSAGSGRRFFVSRTWLVIAALTVGAFASL